MIVKIRPKKAAAYRFGLAYPSLVKNNGEYILPAPIDLNCLPDFVPSGVTLAGGMSVDMAATTTVKDEMGIEQTKIRRRMLKQMLFNRPQFYIGSKGGRQGDQGDATDAACYQHKDNSLPGTVKVNRTYFEQLALSSAYPYTRRIKDGFDSPRAEGTAPTTYAITSGFATKLLMKADLDEIILKRNLGDGTWRQGESDVANKQMGWGNYYSRGASDEPDDPNLSLDYASMWKKGNAPCVCVHPDHKANPTGTYCFTSKASNRDCDRDWHVGEGDFDRGDLYALLRESIDYGSYGYTTIVGNFTDASSGDNNPEENDTPARTKVQTMAKASDAVLRQAASIVWRDWLITLFLSDGYGEYKAPVEWTGPASDAPRTDVSDLWFAKEVTDAEYQILKIALQRVNIFNESGENFASIGGLGCWHYAKLQWSTVRSTKTISRLSSYSSFKLSTDCREAAKTACAYSKFNLHQAPGWSHQLIESYNTFTYDAAARPLVGKAPRSGSWEKVSSGRFGNPSVFYAPASPARGVNCHIEFDSNSAEMLSSTGNVVTIDSELIGNACFALAGYQVGNFNNGAAGFFEDGIESDVDDWDDGDEFFVFFFTQTPEDI